jgi:hypothetical protein
MLHHCKALRSGCLLGISVALFSCHSSTRPKVNFSGHWTTGFVSYSVDTATDSTWEFSGSTFHEGGSAFSLKLDKNGQYLIYPPGLLDTFYKDRTAPDLGKKGDRLVYTQVDTNRVLLVKSPKGAIRDVLVSFDSTIGLGEFYEQCQVLYDLSGVYENVDNHQKVVFSTEVGHVEGLEQGTQYTFEKDYDEPTDVMSFGDGAHIWYERMDDSLLLYKADGGNEERWTKGEKIMTLHRISHIDLPEYYGINGKYPFASTRVMIGGILCFFTKDQLRIMRNEIFARKGFIFTSPEMKTYFSSKSWYRPKYASVDQKLTPLEKLNVEVIKQFETNMSK